jgi:5-methylcytosine-specific restriction enzyme subunit McrC
MLQAPARSRYLVQHEEEPWFRLEPDFLLSVDGQTRVLDTKWKRIDETLNNPTDKYGLSQADFYQLFAYGQRYLNGVGDLLLIYPKTSSFSAPLPVFEFSDTLRLWVVPFDLETGQMVEFGAFPAQALP